MSFIIIKVGQLNKNNDFVEIEIIGRYNTCNYSTCYQEMIEWKQGCGIIPNLPNYEFMGISTLLGSASLISSDCSSITDKLKKLSNYYVLEVTETEIISACTLSSKVCDYLVESGDCSEFEHLVSNRLS